MKIHLSITCYKKTSPLDELALSWPYNFPCYNTSYRYIDVPGPSLNATNPLVNRMRKAKNTRITCNSQHSHALRSFPIKALASYEPHYSCRNGSPGGGPLTLEGRLHRHFASMRYGNEDFCLSAEWQLHRP